MSKIDCERFVRGAKEIDRKRELISRIMGTLGALLNKGVNIKDRHWGFREGILTIPVGEFNLLLLHSKGNLRFELHSSAVRHSHNLRIQLNPSAVSYSVDERNPVPARITPLVYEHLSHIVEEVDAAFPEARIREHFDFFSGQVDA